MSRHPTLNPDDDHTEAESLNEAWRFQDDMERMLFGEGGLLDQSPPVLPMLKKWTGSPRFSLDKPAPASSKPFDALYTKLMRGEGLEE